MPAFLVELAENEKATLSSNKLGKVLVWAGTSADAKDVAKASAEGDSNAAWENATVTDLSTVQNFSHLSLKVQVLDSSPVVDVDVPMPTGNVLKSVVINSGGSPTYVVGDILTINGGTSVRAATLRVTSVNAGVIDGIEVVDPGDTYSVDPTTTANAVTGGGGSGATMDLTMIANDYHNLMGAVVTSLNATTPIAGAAMDFGTGTGGTLTIAVGSGGDDLGDKDAAAWFYVTADPSKTPIDGMLGTLTDLGSATDDLSVLGMATQVSGKVLATL